ncbi:hypothetical protein KIN20_018534, partial [Parelaphostrongylus tenuis]
MTQRMRDTAEFGHNNYSEEKDRGYPKASDLSYLFYSCDLENKSLDIAKSHYNHASHPDFNYVGSNSATFTGRYVNTVELVVAEAVKQWWNTGKPYNPPPNLTPRKQHVRNSILP